MIEFTLTRTTPAAIEDVFDALTDHRAYASITALRHSTLEREGYPAPDGVGAIRRLSVIGPPAREEVTVYERPGRFAYELRSGLPVRDHVGTVELSRTAAGTRIVYTVRATPARPLLGPVLAPVMRRAIAHLLCGVVGAAERQSTVRSRRARQT